MFFKILKKAATPAIILGTTAAVEALQLKGVEREVKKAQAEHPGAKVKAYREPHFIGSRPYLLWKIKIEEPTPTDTPVCQMK